MPWSNRSIVNCCTLSLLLAFCGPWLSRAQDSATPSFTPETVFNAAGYSTGSFASESWVTLYGYNLTEQARVFVPGEGFPTTLGGSTVTVTDAAGIERPASLRFIAKTTLSFLAPADLAIGPATLTVTNALGLSGSTEVRIDRVVPGLFAANEDGRGAVVATFLRVTGGGDRTEGLTFITDAIAGTRSNLPLQFGPAGNELYLSLWGTGFRGGSVTQVRIDDQDIPVRAAVAHSLSPGLDQAVLGPVPRSLLDAGEVDVEFSSDGVAAPALTISFMEDPALGAVIRYEIGALISEVERLVIRGNSLQWIHVVTPDVDPSEQPTLSTSIETTVDRRAAIFASWQPRWSGQRVPSEPGEESSTFTQLWPPFPSRPTGVVLSRQARFDSMGQPLPMRGAVRVVEQPSEANGFAMVLEFDDSLEPDEGGLDVTITLDPLP